MEKKARSLIAFFWIGNGILFLFFCLDVVFLSFSVEETCWREGPTSSLKYPSSALSPLHKCLSSMHLSSERMCNVYSPICSETRTSSWIITWGKLPIRLLNICMCPQSGSWDPLLICLLNPVGRRIGSFIY